VPVLLMVWLSPRMETLQPLWATSARFDSGKGKYFSLTLSQNFLYALKCIAAYASPARTGEESGFSVCSAPSSYVAVDSTKISSCLLFSRLNVGHVCQPLTSLAALRVCLGGQSQALQHAVPRALGGGEESPPLASWLRFAFDFGWTSLDSSQQPVTPGCPPPLNGSPSLLHGDCSPRFIGKLAKCAQSSRLLIKNEEFWLRCWSQSQAVILLITTLQAWWPSQPVFHQPYFSVIQSVSHQSGYKGTLGDCIKVLGKVKTHNTHQFPLVHTASHLIIPRLLVLQK